MLDFNERQNSEIEQLVVLIKQLNLKGHNLATSGNYSLYFESMGDYALVSESGIDKAHFSHNHLLPVHRKTKLIFNGPAYMGRKSSDETAVHLAIYNNTGAGCVLHSHFAESLLFARLHTGKEVITLTGLEMIKAFKGIKSHEENFMFPVFENTQDMDLLGQKLDIVLKSYPKTYAIMLRDHGIYVWGATVQEAKRHLEAFEYIFKFFVALEAMQPYLDTRNKRKIL